MSTRFFLRPVHLVRNRLIENFIDQRRFPGARDTGDGDEQTQRNVDIDVLQVVFRCFVDMKHPTIRLFACRRNRNELLPGQVLTSQRVRILHQLFRFPGCRDESTVIAGTRSDIDQVVGCHHRVFIVFDDDQRVAEITHRLQRIDQTIIITLV